MKSEEPPLVCDATVVFNLGHRGGLSSLVGKFSAQRKLMVTIDVADEVNRDDPAFYSDFLTAHFTINRDPLSHIAEVIEVARPVMLHAGEISVLALCLQNGWTACVDEKEGRKVARQLHLNVMGTLGLLKEAIQKEWMTDDECLDAIRRMRQGGFFCPKVQVNDDFADYCARLN